MSPMTTSTTHRRHFRPRFVSALSTAAGIGIAATLLGCEEHRMSDRTALILNSAETAHPITFHSRVEELAIEIPPNGQGLSQNQYADVYRFAQRYKKEANGHLTVSTPGTARIGGGYESPLEDVRAALLEAEVPTARVRRGTHSRGRGGSNSLKLTFHRPVAIPPECGKWPRDVGEERENVPYPDWGCATQRNIAGMVANPRDLQRPQDEDPRSAERRSATWAKYIAPDATMAGSGSADPGSKAESTTTKK